MAVQQCRIEITRDYGPRVSPWLTGFNVSYFSDLKSLWADGRIPGYLRRIRTGLLRYPGGEETSRYHWETPGARGYLDTWETEGYSNRAKGWKWSAADLAVDNPDHMDTLAFLKWCDVIGGDPMLGVNVSSGIKFDRLQDSLDEIRRWHTYCASHGYRVTFWYVDNEPWHHSTYQQMNMETYADAVTKVSVLLKKLDPEIKIVCNPVSAGAWQSLRRFLELCGKHVDILDLHWYWDWGRVSFDKWRRMTPLTTDSQFHTSGRTYADEIRVFRELVRSLKLDHIELAAHEWNIGPSPEGTDISGYMHCLITAEMMLQFAQGGLHSACMWPLQWIWDRERTMREIEKGEYKGGRFLKRSIISQKPPHRPLPALETFALFGRMLGGRVALSSSSAPDLPVLAVQQDDVVLLYVLNKSENDRRLLITMPGTETLPRSARYETVHSADIHSDSCTVKQGECDRRRSTAAVTVPSFSLTLVSFEGTPSGR